MVDIVLPISIGEALDKLTILEIKISKIEDERHEHCLKEYHLLYNHLKLYIDVHAYHYRILKDINMKIWNLHEDIHNNTNLTDTYGKILKNNDRRFRVKNSINTSANSNLKEQKGYAKTKAFVYTHLGLGDHFCMNGAVRYLATCYDKVTIVCKKNNEINVRAMYSDDPNILFFVVPEDIYPFTPLSNQLKDSGFDVYACGIHTDCPKIYEIPYSFYDDMLIPRNYTKEYFYIPNFEESTNMLNSVKTLTSEYIMLHQECSTEKFDIFSKLKTDIPVLDIKRNNYEIGHKFYNVAELVVNKQMVFYKKLIENASEIHCVNSSFYCLACHLDLSNVSRKICYIVNGNTSSALGIFTDINL